MPEVADLTALAAVVADFTMPSPVHLDDAALMDAQRRIAETGRHLDAMAASVAAEIRHRSRRELGHDGLAQRLGARTPEKLVQTLTGSSLRDAQTFIRVGEVLSTPPADAAPSTPWLVDVAAAVLDATLSIDAADAIRAGLGAPTEEVPAEALHAAAARLLLLAPSLPLEQLAAEARNLRAELDLDRAQEREAAMRDRRFLRFTQQLDGMTRVSGLLDPESAAHIVTAVDAALAPRRGPRFVDPASAARADALIRDERSNDQITVDTFVELIRLATNVDDGTVLGSRHPVVQIHVTDRDLRERRGLGRIEGQPDPVSIATVERYVCDSGAIPIAFDQHGQVLDLGRTHRTFTTRQRIALAARDGGCRFPNCDRPASWTEAHHITEWSRGGKTDVADGVLLCRHHHMMIHNNGWQITRAHADYFLTPPEAVDPRRRRIPLPTKSRTLRRALAAG